VDNQAFEKSLLLKEKQQKRKLTPKEKEIIQGVNETSKSIKL
jgi:hypothetical protein